MLISLTDNLWVQAAPFSLIGFHVGTRMTIVRLKDDSLLLHSPIPITSELAETIETLGAVHHVVCPNMYHHLYAGDAMKYWPDAILHGPERLRRKRPDLPLSRALQEREPDSDWAGVLTPLTIGGCLLEETVLIHEPSATVISSDLLENFTTSLHPPTKMYLHIGGVNGKVGWSRLLRWMYWNRKRARRDMARLLEQDFDRIVLAHGDVIEKDGNDLLREGMHWLLKV